MAEEFYIPRNLSDNILTIGVSKKTYGGMTSVLVSYEKYFETTKFIPTWRLGSRIVKAFYAFQAVFRCFFLLLFDKKIKIIHIHSAAYSSFFRKKIFIDMGKFFNKNVIMHQHAADFKEFYESSNNKEYIVDTINRCDVLIVLSNSWKSFFKSIGVEDQKIYILNNIVSPPANNKNFSFNRNKLNLLFLGEISNRKGVLDLLNVIKKRLDFFDGKVFLRIGGNIVDFDLNKFIGNNKLNTLVKYEGWVSGDLKSECLEWSDVYILPSYNEGLPIAILEAMSYGKPIIATPVGGIPEILQSYSNGILVSPGNLDEIDRAITFFIENPSKKSEYGKYSYKIVQSYFPEQVFLELKAIYQSLIKNTNEFKSN